ncbi:MAG: DUF2723 domain-containing protein [SAR202 cluster bacterium]|nr:DUF2723 domain-containing protein [SAR202 cluster bacterium]MDP6512339.1 DUF2723 domain-containing protein [SAR202 cluster bacterium]
MTRLRQIGLGPSIGIATTLAALGLYLLTVAPTLSWGWRDIGVDGGDLLAAAYNLGVPHPSGYPTFMLLLKGFGTLFPVGDFAFRGNLLSALMGASSSGFLYWFVYRISSRLETGLPVVIRALASSFAALTFATAPLFWSQAVITEVYTLNAFFVGALCVEASYLTDTRPANRNLILATGLTLGLGMGNHLTLLAIAVPLGVWVTIRRSVTISSAGGFAIGLLVGLSVYVYLPIRAGSDPLVNWGDAASLSGLYWVVSGQAYQDFVFGVPIESLGQKLITWLELVFEQLNPLGIFLAIGGISSLLKSERLLLGATGASAAGLLAYSIFYNTFDSQVLTIPAFFIISAYSGIGLFNILASASQWVDERFDSEQPESLKRRLPIGVLILIAFLTVPAIAVYLNYESQDRSEDRRASEYAERLLESVPPGAVVLSDTEDRVFALWYYGFVEERDNPGIIPVSSRLLQFDWYWNSLVERHPDIFPQEMPEDVADALVTIVESASDEPGVYFTFFHPFLADNFVLVSEVSDLYQAAPK